MPFEQFAKDPLFQFLLTRQEDIEHGYKKHENGYVMNNEQIATMNTALGLKKDAYYRPYCLADDCRTMPRMFVCETDSLALIVVIR